MSKYFRNQKSKLELDEMNRFVATIQKEKEYIEKVARPKFIRYCKVYTDIKKAHARELRTTGYIKYNKVDDQSTKAQTMLLAIYKCSKMQIICS